MNPDEVAALVANHVPRPLPEGLSPEEQVRYARLMPYRVDCPRELLEKQYGNLPRSVKMPPSGHEPIVIPEGMTPPPVPTALPILRPEKMLQGKYARRVLSKEEYDLFSHTWVEWLTPHPEWTKPEDRDDLLTICMETVMMHRLSQIAHDKPGTDTTEAYNASFKRKQKARENLTARRVDQVGSKANGGNSTTFNVAVMAGNLPPEEVAKRKLIAAKDVTDELAFLNKTAARPQVTIDEPTEDEDDGEPKE